MLPITQELIDSIHQKDRAGQPIALSGSYLHTILACGTAKDAEALLATFLEKPSDFERTLLLPAVGQLGTTAMAQTLFDHCFSNHRLKKGMPEAVLHTLGQLRYEAAADMLLFYALDASSDYYTSRSAALGLLHFSCEGYEVFIEEAIRNTFDKPLFQEFVPSLVCKLKNKEALLAAMYEHGSTVCSTDCNAGILLGFALSGSEGAGYFRKVLLDPFWETASTGTGTGYWASRGMEYAGVKFQELFATSQQESNDEQLRSHLYVIERLLHVRLQSAEEPLLLEHKQQESFAAIYEALYGWQSPNDRNNILDLADKVDLTDDYHALEELLLVKVEEELLLRCVKDAGSL